MTAPDLSPPGLSRRALLRRAALGAGVLAAAGLAQGPAAAAFGPAATRTVAADAALRFARVRPRTAKQLLAMGAFDETHAVLPDGSMELLLWPGDEARLRRLGVDYRVFAPRTDVGARATGLAAQPGERSAYRRPVDFGTDLMDLAARFPEQSRLFEMPERSLEGRTVYGIEIADDIAAAQTDGRPTFWVDGAHHSREWPSSEYSIMFAHDLLENRATDDRVAELLTRIKVVVVPIVNIDGYTTSRDAVYATTPVDRDIPFAITGTMTGWRKNRRSFTGALYGPAGTRSELNLDAHGVDPNRNYPFYWGGEGGGSTNPTSQTYGGAEPFSEPEARNVASVMKGQQVTAYLTNHTYGRLCMRPWGYTTEPSPDSDLQEDLGARMCAFTGYRNQIGLSLYPTAGTSRDWSYGALSTIVYTFEHGRSFHPSYAGEVPATYALNRPAWLLLAEAAADPANHGVITGRVLDGGRPVAGAVIEVTKTFNTPTAEQFEKSDDYTAYRTTSTDGVSETVRSRALTRGDGTFEVHCNPSTRPTVVQDGRESETWTVRVTDADGALLHSREVLVGRGDRASLGDVRVVPGAPGTVVTSREVVVSRSPLVP